LMCISVANTESSVQEWLMHCNILSEVTKAQCRTKGAGLALTPTESQHGIPPCNSMLQTASSTNLLPRQMIWPCLLCN